MTGRRVAVTGIGVLAPGGVGTENFWDLLSAGRTATRGITFFDPSSFRSRVAAEIDFDAEAHGLTPQETRRMDRAAQFAVVATREALTDSGIALDAHAPHRVGVTVGSAVGATMGLDQEYRVVSDGGRLDCVDHTYAVPHLYDYLVPSSFAAEVAWAVGAEGPSTVVSTGCTSGIDSVGYAVELIREGSADVMIAGSSDAPISPITMACFDAIKATTPRHDDPEHASRPFDGSRNGFVLGEGAAVFVLEELEAARRRGARVYAEIAGYATRSNAYHMTGLRPDGAEMAEAIRSALDEARIAPQDVDYINAHGSGTKQNDRHETAAFKRSLKDHAYRVPVSSIKSMVGHSLGAIGSIEIAASALAMRHNVVPPTANLHTPDPECDLDYVPLAAREWTTDTVLTVGSGFGGFQSAMVLARPERSLA
ncbi:MULTISPECIES: beta-ketoacyl-[acyl-carrier-protein] synthase family protein [unclassified Streptomyces]|uniref:beta-ketoacyl-[acyl-carrier-protein] synthase family protein n=1 Tax=Streptomyces TaxID=1883 RepID=UPI0001C1A856|nr:MULTISPECIES: beta-ketoacyl-[acyl-carrier-protein] synthase family protein [unclassified Streptomyces]MYR66857.1 beta-ketoacyl-ACP synthase II [Streptomyces sp. SID4939]MYT66071.1 beta-ketoacyl-ACP synthase II [Streptomyces sp. SID8357]MYT88853.1 beta-ketoacyl-ACP synthase II [Streptomyces sp. SID8360]MYU37533.1 beta-ketoacyl-ACP synthase II [Streptomyces sp. SID8358]MYW41564.1 beta-ketoacyl-ACP synthase II [Streptomyces sp. SID1]MYX74985.1 beta-ketoacyl-ACP synthase II [Streptomyces sp. S